MGEKNYQGLKHEDYAEIIIKELPLDPKVIDSTALTVFLRRLDRNPQKAYSKFIDGFVNGDREKGYAWIAKNLELILSRIRVRKSKEHYFVLIITREGGIQGVKLHKSVHKAVKELEELEKSVGPSNVVLYRCKVEEFGKNIREEEV